MSFLVGLSLVFGIAASGLSIYEFLKKHKASGTIYAVVAVALILAAFFVAILPSLSGSAVSGSNKPGNTPTSTISSQQGTTVTTVPTTSATIAPTQNPTTTPTPTLDYSAAQPGPGPQCDTNGGIWTEKALNQIKCVSGTEISSNYNSLGYLYLQLPNNATFSSNNKISIMGGNLSYVTGSVCLGLAEQGTSTGVLGEFCGNGGWFIYSLSSTGVITQSPLNQGITSVRTSEEISLTLQGNTALFSIDTETYKATISSIQPVKVGITSFNETPNNYNTITITNFSYMTSAS